MDTYTKYNTMDFVDFSIDKILDSIEESEGFMLSTVFSKKYSIDINLKRHEDHKNWLYSKDLSYMVLDGVQKVRDEGTGQMKDNSILYILTLFNRERIAEDMFEDLSRVLIKRYDINQVILKLPKSKDIEVITKEHSKKVFKNISSLNTETLIRSFFKGLGNKTNFNFVGIEKPKERETYANLRRRALRPAFV